MWEEFVAFSFAGWYTEITLKKAQIWQTQLSHQRRCQSSLLTQLVGKISFAPVRGFIFLGVGPTTEVVGYFRLLLRGCKSDISFANDFPRLDKLTHPHGLSVAVVAVQLAVG